MYIIKPSSLNSSHRAHNCRNAVASRGITRVLPYHSVLSTACRMALFHFISLCPISNLAALLHLWWRNVTARSRLITHKVQFLYRVWPVRGDTLWSYPIAKITAFWDPTPSLSKECPAFRQIVVTSSSEPSWDCLTLTTTALRLFETSGPADLTTYQLYFT